MTSTLVIPSLEQVQAELAKRSLLEYAAMCWPNYRAGRHHEVIAKALHRVEAGNCKRLMIFAPPRHGKSMLVSEFFPAWYLGRNPDKYVIHATYAQELAEDWGRKIRNQLADPLFSGAFRYCKLSTDSASQKKLNTSRGGAYYALGVGGAATGRGAHLLLIDDPLKGREEADSDTIRHKLQDWYKSVAYTRLMPDGAVVIIQTRWHEDDLSGWLLRDHADEDWEVVSLPAIAEDDDILGRQPGEALWPTDYPVDALERIKQQLGTREWSALYQQRPVPSEGSLFNLDWFRRYQAAPVIGVKVQSWDTGTKDEDIHDPSVCTTWRQAGSGYYLLDVFRQRLQFPDLRRSVESLALRDNPDVILIEDKGSGQQLIQVLKAETRLPIVAIPAIKSKVARAQGISGTVEAGRVFLPDRSNWLADFESEIGSFPVGKHDDQVDSLTQAVRYMIDTQRKVSGNDAAWAAIPSAGSM